MIHSSAERLPKRYSNTSGNSNQSQEVIVDERALVFAQLHPLDPPIKLRARLLYSFQRIFRLLFVVNVDFGKLLADVGERAKVRPEGNTEQFAFQVRPVTLAIERFDLRFRFCWSI